MNYSDGYNDALVYWRQKQIETEAELAHPPVSITRVKREGEVYYVLM